MVPKTADSNHACRLREGAQSATTAKASFLLCKQGGVENNEKRIPKPTSLDTEVEVLMFRKATG
jgi:hypothetical protein